MALFHLHVTQVRRSAGQSVVTSAAYRAGEKLYSEYYGEVSDYTHKGGVVCTDILLPPQAPAEYKDRATLWNAVEKAERGKKAQLAYSFDIALQNEFSLEENIALARQFVSEQLVGRGMIADFAIHQPDKEDGGIPNPHFHVLCPIRPIEESGKWGYKQRRVYRLDEDGNRIMGEDGKPLFDAIPTTDWGSPETLEHWREAWAAMVNAKFEEKGLTCRIDHRSYERQGLDLLPTVHEGVAVRQMEAKGITTDKGDLNRWIKKANNILRDIRKKIAGLTDWIKAIKEELSQPQAPTLAALLTDYYAGRNAGAWSRNARIGNLKDFAAAVNFLTEKGIVTLEDLEAHIAVQSERTEAINTSMKAKRDRLNELKELLRLVDLYRDTMDASTQWLIDRLVEMGPEQALSFDNIVHSYRDLAYKYGLWSAASVLCDGCTDEGFIDFRGWLIAQGREVYMAALKDPDSLADVPAYGGCCFESLSYVGDYAYEKLTGQDSYDRFDRNAYQRLVEELKKDVVYGEGIDYPYTWSETAAYLPRLCSKHMTPEELAWRINCHNDTWNITSPDIQSARATAQKSKKIKKDRGESR